MSARSWEMQSASCLAIVGLPQYGPHALAASMDGGDLQCTMSIVDKPADMAEAGA